MKAYPNYKKFSGKWIDEIPAHWNQAYLKRITQLLYGDSLSKDNRDEGDVPVFGSNGVVGFHNYSITKSPCIIVGRKGSFGKVSYSESECFPIDTTYYIDETATQNNLRWIYYLLQSLKLDAYSKDSAVPGLSREDAYSRKAPFPELPEQQAIANFLDSKTAQIDTLIDKKQRLIALLQEYRTALINQAVTKGLDPNVPMKDSGVKWFKNIPSHWKISKVGRHFTLGRGRVISIVEISENVGHYPVYSSQTKNDGIMGHINSFDFEGDFITWTTDGANAGTVFFREGRFNCTNVCGTMQPKRDFDVFLPYVSSLLNQGTRYYVRYDINPKLMNGEMAQIEICIPPYQEQQEIFTYLNNKMGQIDKLMMHISKEIQLFSEYRTSLVSSTVTGKIDVRNQG